MVILAVVVMLVLEGLAMYAAHRAAVEVARGAATQAAEAFVHSSGSEAAAARVAEGIAAEGEVRLISASYHKGTTRWYEVTVCAQPKSYVLARLPYVRDYLLQESTAVVHF